MNNLFYNPKYKTKQIFDINAAPVDDPQPGEAFYWITSENSKIYANFKAYGVSGIKTVEIGSNGSFDPDEVLAGILDSLSQKIAFTSANSTAVSWSGNKAAFTHTLNCLPVVTIYDNGRNLVMADVSATDSAHFSVDFGDRSAVAGTWTCVVAYGSEW